MKIVGFELIFVLVNTSEAELVCFVFLRETCFVSQFSIPMTDALSSHKYDNFARMCSCFM